MCELSVESIVNLFFVKSKLTSSLNVLTAAKSMKSNKQTDFKRVCDFTFKTNILKYIFKMLVIDYFYLKEL